MNKFSRNIQEIAPFLFVIDSMRKSLFVKYVLMISDYDII